MDEVRRDGEVILQFRLGLYEFEHFSAAAVAEFTDEAVVFRVLAEFFDGGREDYQLAAVGDRHSRAVDRLVAEPRALEFARVEIDDDFVKRLIHVREVRFLAFRDGHLEQFAGAPDEHVVDERRVALVRRYREDIHQRDSHEKILLSVVENAAHGREILAHHALHAVKRAEHVRGVYHRRAAASDEDVFRVVRHADDLVRHHLPDRNDEVVRLVKEPLVHFDVDLRVDEPF